MQYRTLSTVFLVTGLFTLLIASGGCTTSTQAFYTTPEDAVDDLVRAARQGNTERLHEIFGKDSDQLLDSGDPVADRAAAERFVAAIDERYRLEELPNGSVTIYAGNENWLFPIPIVLGKNGWVFDTPTGVNEVINRRVGRNETDAVEVCKAVVAAQEEYLLLDPDGDEIVEYAQKFVSDPGRKNGLYWPTSPGEEPSPIGELAADAAAEGYVYDGGAPRLPRPFHGYRFRILKAQGEDAPGGAINYMIGDRMIAGHALVAYPAVYGNSGVMTFIVNRDGIVYQRDLGPNTAEVAGTMTTYNPGPGWMKVE